MALAALKVLRTLGVFGYQRVDVAPEIRSFFEQVLLLLDAPAPAGAF